MKRLSILLLIIFSFNALAEIDEHDPKKNNKEVFVKEEKNRFRIYLLTDYTTIASPAADGVALTGVGFTVQGHAAFAERWGAGLSSWQSFSLTGASVITSFDGRLTYALTGKMISIDKQTMIDSIPVSNVTDYDTSGFRAQLIAVQYYFNASANTVPYHGFGISAFYEHATNNRISWVGGARYDMISNSSFSTTPIQFFLGIGTPF